MLDNLGASVAAGTGKPVPGTICRVLQTPQRGSVPQVEARKGRALLQGSGRNVRRRGWLRALTHRGTEAVRRGDDESGDGIHPSRRHQALGPSLSTADGRRYGVPGACRDDRPSGHGPRLGRSGGPWQQVLDSGMLWVEGLGVGASGHGCGRNDHELRADNLGNQLAATPRPKADSQKPRRPSAMTPKASRTAAPLLMHPLG
jgi:hypothetical protein